METETKMTHTPGPWTTKDAVDKRPVWSTPNTEAPPSGIDEEPMKVVCTQHVDAACPRICYVWDDQREGMEANARLIAAAPDMLEALRGVIDLAECEAGQRADVAKHGDGPDNPDEWVDEAMTACAIARAALAKATGEE
jgi:hypothetical protein